MGIQVATQEHVAVGRPLLGVRVVVPFVACWRAVQVPDVPVGALVEHSGPDVFEGSSGREVEGREERGGESGADQGGHSSLRLLRMSPVYSAVGPVDSPVFGRGRAVLGSQFAFLQHCHIGLFFFQKFIEGGRSAAPSADVQLDDLQPAPLLLGSFLLRCRLREASRAGPLAVGPSAYLRHGHAEAPSVVPFLAAPAEDGVASHSSGAYSTEARPGVCLDITCGQQLAARQERRYSWAPPQKPGSRGVGRVEVDGFLV